MGSIPPLSQSHFLSPSQLSLILSVSHTLLCPQIQVGVHRLELGESFVVDGGVGLLNFNGRIRGSVVELV